MQLKDIHRLLVLNTDDAPADLQPGEVTDMLNMRSLSSSSQHGSGNAETLQGEVSVLINPNSLITYYGTSIGGNFVYPGFLECKIGNQVWMKKNWDAKYPGSKVYGDDENNRDVYGGLYTHGQIMASDFCPDGWHVPTEAEVDILIAELLGEAVAGGKLKDIGWWDAPNTGADDSSGFKAMPGGGFGMDVMYYGSAIGSDFVYDLLGSTGLLWLADEVPDIIGGVITDIDGNVYTSVIIGTQEWLVENLKTTHYADGTLIPLITDNAAWMADTLGAICYYNNDIANKPVYGAMYNWFGVNNAHQIAVGQFTEGGVPSVGWKVPSDADFQALINFIGGEMGAGGKLKEVGATHWNTSNLGTDDYGFKAVGSGERYDTIVGVTHYYFLHIGGIDDANCVGFIWSSSDHGANGGELWINGSTNYAEVTASTKPYGGAVRCVRDI